MDSKFQVQAGKFIFPQFIANVNIIGPSNFLKKTFKNIILHKFHAWYNQSVQKGSKYRPNPNLTNEKKKKI